MMDVSLQRLHRISDLIFALAMTIMVLLLKLPTEDQLATQASFEQYLTDSLPNFYIFLVTFLVVAIYWAKDVEQYKYVTKTNSSHMWLQLGSLAFLIVLPWTNGLLEIKPDNLNVRIIYCIDIFLIGLFSSLAWRYASKNHRLIEKELDQKVINKILEVNASEPIIALIAIASAFFAPDLFILTFILIPVLFMAQKRILNKAKKKDTV